MASQQRSRHGHQPSLVSDYESDVHYLSDMQPAPAMSRPKGTTPEELNLRIVSRYRPDTVSLEYVVPFVTVYKFSAETRGWEKCEMDGPTFLCALTSTEEYAYRCAVVLLNRRGLDNLNVELVSSKMLEITDQFIMVYQEVAGQMHTYGLYPFSDNGADSSTAHIPTEFAAKLQECVKKAESSKRKRNLPQSNGHRQEESQPMGRQISLRELFGQQRQDDDSFSVRSHSPSRRASGAAPVPALIPELVQTSTPQFQSSADTDFFRSGSMVHSQPVPPLPPQPSAQVVGQQQTLLDLFKRASEQRAP